ncbi:hypothetical protein CLV47_12921 [Antricoccus suffuscus]|uniref:Uncharacterized protein n=1 Tax=Antricoccus suffuscus TaxID=1629062 RepID=A0A2T0Z359_9ACTN|nr:hypothetical protein [Antricoccus suffuscus]PRZ30779.1 hypothetical protein CLV47_12921 [Antricoccus suffuscus]
MAAYVPPSFGLYEAFEPGVPPTDSRRWLVDVRGNADQPAAAVTLGYRSATTGLLVGTSASGVYQSEYDLKLRAMTIMMEGSQSSSRRKTALPTADDVFNMADLCAAMDDLWTPYRLTLDGSDINGFVSTWDTGWALVSRLDVDLTVAGMQPVPGTISLRRVAASDDYGIDLGQSLDVDTLNTNRLSQAPAGSGLE